MRRLLLFTLLLGIAITAFAQSYPSTGLLRAQATFAIGKDTWLTGAKPYLFGEFEAMPDDHVGIAGSVLVHLSRNEMATQPNLYGVWEAHTHHVLLGPMWHFKPHQPLDVHVGLQPGFTAVVFNGQLSETNNHRPSITPSVAGTAGVAYYGSFFHVFAQAKLITGYQASEIHRGSLTEGLLTAGLGWNLNVQR
jgi:hypothetical protein